MKIFFVLWRFYASNETLLTPQNIQTLVMLVYTATKLEYCREFVLRVSHFFLKFYEVALDYYRNTMYKRDMKVDSLVNTLILRVLHACPWIKGIAFYDNKYIISTDQCITGIKILRFICSY